MNDRLEPLDDELGALFARERAAHVSDAFERDRAWQRVELALGLAARTAATGVVVVGAATAATSLAGELLRWKRWALGLAVFGAGLAAGEGHARLTHVAAPAPPVVVVASAPVGSAAALELTPAATPSAVEIASLPIAPPLAQKTSAEPLGPASALVAEQKLIDQARAALGRQRGTDAIAALQTHAARFPGGGLSEERDALLVQSHAVAGNVAQTHARALRFHAKYPGSIFGGAVDRAVASLPTDPPVEKK